MSETEHNHWQGLYKIGAVIAVILLVYSLVTMLLMVAVGGQPGTVQEIFAMLQGNRLVGLLRLDLLTMLVMPLYYLLLLALYMALKKAQALYASIAAVLGFAGLTLFLASPSVFSWLALSDRHLTAASEAQKALVLAAGEAILAADIWHGTGAFLGGVLLQVATTLLSLAMLRSSAFGKSTAIAGIVTHGLDLAHVLVGVLFSTGGVILMAIAGPLYLLWFPLLARDFWRLSKKGDL
ncbi:MAG: hypothetical protein AB1894_04725 [Chloroflexota bacterium]